MSLSSLLLAMLLPFYNAFVTFFNIIALKHLYLHLLSPSSLAIFLVLHFSFTILRAKANTSIFAKELYIIIMLIFVLAK